jgi:hypothetical protein
MSLVNQKLAKIELVDPEIDEIRAALKSYDADLEKLINGVAKKAYNLVLQGAPGTGKTQAVTDILTKSKTKVFGIKGVASAIGLYKVMYENSSSVIVLDDCDNLFDILEATEILKAAMDSKAQCKISWAKQNTNLASLGMDNEFIFTGKLILITNKDLTPGSGRLTKAQRLMAPILDRAPTVKTGLPSREWELEYLKMLHEVGGIKLFKERKIPKKIQNEMIAFIYKESSHFSTMSFRTLVKMADFYNNDKDSWKELSLMSIG